MFEFMTEDTYMSSIAGHYVTMFFLMGEITDNYPIVGIVIVVTFFLGLVK